jgi:hypothetical protein
MGIYPSETIYGLSCFFDDAIIFKKTYTHEMTNTDFSEVKALYDKLDLSRGPYSFNYFTICSSTYGTEPFLSWVSIDAARMHALMHPTQS